MSNTYFKCSKYLFRISGTKAVFQVGNHIIVLWSDGTYDELYKYDRYAVLP